MAEGYTLGVDLGSLSARAVIVRVWDGCVVATGEEAYEHGVIEGSIGGIPIPEGMFLQKPGDFIRSLQKSVRKALQNGNVDPGEIMGIGVDATSPHHHRHGRLGETHPRIPWIGEPSLCPGADVEISCLHEGGRGYS